MELNGVKYKEMYLSELECEIINRFRTGSSLTLWNNFDTREEGEEYIKQFGGTELSENSFSAIDIKSERIKGGRLNIYALCETDQLPN